MKVKPEKLDDYYLSKLQDDLTRTIEAIHDLEARVASIQNKVESLKHDKGLPPQSLSVRGLAEFLE